MKAAWTMVLGLAVVCALVFNVRAADKEETLKGSITCAKCDLKKQNTCATVIKVKDTVYYFDTDSAKKYHKEICQTPKDGTVTGTVSEKDGKKTVMVKKVEFAK